MCITNIGRPVCVFLQRILHYISRGSDIMVHWKISDAGLVVVAVLRWTRIGVGVDG